MRERIQKIVSSAGLASRRAAEEWIRAGRVTLNGVPAQLGDRADPERDVIAVDGRRLERTPPAYWLLHKPRGILTTRRDPFGRPTVIDLLPRLARGVFPVGRLDRDSEGLLLLTNDGAVAQALLHPSLGSEKEYEVTVRGRVAASTLRRLARGVELRDGRTAPARVGAPRYRARVDRTTFRLVLHEGRKRQIRRSMSFLGHPVQRLVRVRIGPLRLARLGEGEARPLSVEEAKRLRRYAEQRLRGRGAGGAGSQDGIRDAGTRCKPRERHRKTSVRTSR